MICRYYIISSLVHLRYRHKFDQYDFFVEWLSFFPNNVKSKKSIYSENEYRLLVEIYDFINGHFNEIEASGKFTNKTDVKLMYKVEAFLGLASVEKEVKAIIKKNKDNLW